MKSLFLFVYFVTMLAVDPVSSGRNICIPCSGRFAFLCDNEEKGLCIKDNTQLMFVLNKTERHVDARATIRETQFCNESLKLTISACIASMAGAIIVVTVSRVCKYRRRSCLQRDQITQLNKALLAEKSTCAKKEEIIRRSLFKKNIDATLSRSELKKLIYCMGSVGIIFWNNVGRGTAVRIGSNFILTCWHVIEPIVLPPGKVDLRGNAAAAMDLKSLKNKDIVHVDFSENTRFDGCRFGFKPKVCFLDKKLDICILELEADRKDLPDPIELFRDIQSMGMETTKRFVHVIGQHPDTSNIVIDPGCELILHDDKKVESAKKWIKKNKRDILRHGPNEHHIRQSYDEVFETKKHLILDTFLEFGASGGAVVTLTPDGRVALVAILMRGLPAWFWNKKSQECGFPSELRLEVGCFFSLILGSNEWIESEKNRIFGFLVETEVNERMDTAEHEIRIQTRIGSASFRKNKETESMDTNQGEEEAVDNELSRLTLQNTC